jgi:hypothetical protein
MGTQDGKMKGLLFHELPNSIKFQLRTILLQIEPQIKLFFSMKDEIVKKFWNGEGNFEPFLEDGKPNINHAKCVEEIAEVVKQKINLEHPEFKIEDFDFETEEYFPILFYLIENSSAKQNGTKQKGKKQAVNQ